MNFLETTDKIPTFQFPDQDFLTEYFRGKWRSLPWYYNALKTLRIIHTSLWDDNEIRCLHYILNDKPWKKQTVEDTNIAYSEVDGSWWEHYNEMAKSLRDVSPKDWEFVHSLVGQ